MWRLRTIPPKQRPLIQCTTSSKGEGQPRTKLLNILSVVRRAREQFEAGRVFRQEFDFAQESQPSLTATRAIYCFDFM
jgi:hypothetical protein